MQKVMACNAWFGFSSFCGYIPVEMNDLIPDKDGPEWLVSGEPVPYEEALRAMEARVLAVVGGKARELVWLLEHPPLYTAGSSADPAELIQPDRFPVYQIGRGGKHTYHGPGQRVVYVMMDLAKRDRDLRAHVWRLEEWIIRVLAHFGVTGERRADRIGVWVAVKTPLGVQEKKIAALGLRARQWVTSHGLALNVNPDLSHFEGIVPCGIKGYGVTSLHDLGVTVSMEEVDAAFRETFADVFISAS